MIAYVSAISFDASHQKRGRRPAKAEILATRRPSRDRRGLLLAVAAAAGAAPRLLLRRRRLGGPDRVVLLDPGLLAVDAGLELGLRLLDRLRLLRGRRLPGPGRPLCFGLRRDR